MSKPIFDEQKAEIEYLKWLHPPNLFKDFESVLAKFLENKIHRRRYDFEGAMQVARWAHAEAVKQCEAEIQSLEQELLSRNTPKVTEAVLRVRIEEMNKQLESERLRCANLSAIIRRFKRYAGTREPSVACEKILEVKCEHLLDPVSPLRTDETLASFKEGK